MAGTRAIAGNLGLVRALHFPRACLPIAFTLMQLQQLLFSMVVLVVILLVSASCRRSAGCWSIPALLLQSVFNTGSPLVVARLGAKITDIAQLMPFILRTWMYVSGVMWSIDNAHRRTAPELRQDRCWMSTPPPSTST